MTNHIEKHLVAILRAVNAVLVVVLVLNMVLVVATPPKTASATCAVLDDIAKIKQDIASVKENIASAQKEVAGQVKTTVTAGVNQAISAAGVDVSKVTSMAKLEVEALKNFSNDALKEAVAAGKVYLNEIKDATMLERENLKVLAETAIKEAVGAGALKFDQIASMAGLEVTDVSGLVEKTINEAVSKGTIKLDVVTDAGMFASLQLDVITMTGLDEAREKGTTILESEHARIFSAARSQIDAVVGQLSAEQTKQILANSMLSVLGIDPTSIVNSMVSKLVSAGTISFPKSYTLGVGIDATTVTVTQAEFVNNILGVTGITKLTDTGAVISAVSAEVQKVFGVSLPSSMLAVVNPYLDQLGTRTTSVFANKVEEVLRSEAIADLSKLAGAVNTTQLTNTIAKSINDATGGVTTNITNIQNSIQQVASTDFAAMIEKSVTAKLTQGMQTLTGELDLARVQSVLSGQTVQLLGGGNVTAIAGAMSGATGAKLTEAIQGAYLTQMSGALSGMQTTDIASIQRTMAENMSILSGGNMASISTSLTGVNQAALTSTIKESINLSVAANLSGLPSLSGANIEALIGEQIRAITGTGEIAAIQAAIKDNMATAIGAVAAVQDQLKTAMASVTEAQAAIAGLQNQLKDGVQAMAGPTVDAICEALGEITGYVAGLVTAMTGIINGVIDGLKNVIMNFLTTGNLDMAQLQSVMNNATDGVKNIVDGSSSTSSSSGEASDSASSDTSSSGSSGGEGAGGAAAGGAAAGAAGGAAGGGGLPFGGLVAQATYCTCSFNFVVYFLDLAGTAIPGLVWQPGASITFANGPPLRSGSWMLGLWSPGGICLMYVGKGCITITPPPIGVMYMVGTSG